MYQASPFAKALLADMRRWRANEEYGDPNVRCSPMWRDWTDGIWPAHRELAGQAAMDDNVRLHSHIAALNSSMAFAFNLFLPFLAGLDLGAALAPVVGPMTIEAIRFEWIPPGDLLGEIDGEAPRPDEAATGIDVVVHGHRDDGRKLAVLIEVKLSEEGFSVCGGRESRGNKRQDLCADGNAFMAEPKACYLTHPVRKQRDRRYWTIFGQAHGSVAATFPGVSPGPCPFAGPTQQPMRQYALALGMEQRGMVDEAWLVLVHHDENPDVAGQWRDWSALVRPDAKVARLPATALIDACRTQGEAAWSRWMLERYRLGER